MAKDQPAEHTDSKADTMKFQKFKETTRENSGQLNLQDSASKEFALSGRLNEKDIRIVTLPPKDRIKLLD